jgi:hypothetical protein
MKTPLVTLFVACSCGVTVSLGQGMHTQSANVERLILLPGPYLLSPAGATGEVAPGQWWHVTNAPKATTLPPANVRAQPVSTSLMLGRSNTIPTIGQGTLTLSSEGTLTLSSRTYSPHPALRRMPSENPEQIFQIKTKLSAKE